VNLDGLDPHWLWLIAAAILASAEIVAPGVFLIFLAAAAALTGLAALIFGIPFLFQLALFPLFAIGAVHFGRRHYADRPVPTSDPHLNERTARLIGQTVTVVAAIEHGSGRVRVGDSIWNARGEDAEVGSHVRVVGAEGTCLTVEHVSALPPHEGSTAT
jgi:inner membrane protein